jgi:protein-S-isoprenylcysteine O-methyltransferase Ste14
MVYLACACWTAQSWALLLTPFAFWLLDAWIVRTEERHLLRIFGPEYESYMARVRRWV